MNAVKILIGKERIHTQFAFLILITYKFYIPSENTIILSLNTHKRLTFS